MKQDDVYLKQILDAIEKTQMFTQKMTFAQFAKDQKTQSAVIMQLALIGELAKRLSQDTCSSIDVAWKEIRGFRNRAIHEYYQLDIEIVWETVHEDLLILADEIKKFLSL